MSRLWLAALLLAASVLPARSDPPARRDGSHDFDFETAGTWRTHVKRLVKPLTGSTTWVEYDGTTVVRPLFGGRGNMVELDVKGPAGHIEGISVRLYNATSHQWSQTYASATGGVLNQPAVGEFRDGRGELYDQELYDGRMILVRAVWSNITPKSARFEQSFSDDGGKTWELNWIGVDTRS